MTDRYNIKIFLSILILFFSCKNHEKNSNINLCDTRNFNKPIHKFLLSDTFEIKGLSDKFIEVEGFFSYEFENVALYSKKGSQSTTALWLNFSNNLANHNEELDLLNHKKVTLIGKLNVNKKGHLGGYIASLDSVFCIKFSNDK